MGGLPALASIKCCKGVGCRCRATGVDTLCVARADVYSGRPRGRVWHRVCDIGGRMRLHLVWAASFVVSSLIVPATAMGQDKPKDEVRYKFRKGDSIKYETTSALEVTQVGTHADFLQNGNERPLTWNVNGTFENKVVDVDEGGNAQLERHVLQISSSGHVQEEKFKFSWDKAKDKDAPDENKLASLMDRFIANMISQPTKYAVDAEGKTSTQFPDFGRLVMRRGMMFWPVKDEMSWINVEEIAMPVLHDKIKIEFKNTVTGDASGSGYKLRKINSVGTLKESAAAGFHQFELSFSLTANAKPEFDMTNGRLRKLELDIKLNFSGKGQTSDGGQGDIKGVATYKETQVLKD